MFRRFVLLATMAAVTVAAPARADQITTNATVTSVANTPGSIGDVVQVTSGQNGISYTTAAGSSVGSAVYALSSTLLSGFNQGNGTSGNFTNATNDFVVAAALTGHQIAATGGATFKALFTSGVAEVFAITKGTYNVNNPNSWINGTVVATLALGPQTTTLPNIPPNGAPILVGSADQNTAAVNTNLSNGTFPPTDGFLNFLNNGTDTIVTPPQSFTGFQTNISEVFQVPPFPFLPSNSTLDSVFNQIAGGSTSPFTTTGFNPSTGQPNPDTVQSLTASFYPVIPTTTPPSTIPEIDPNSAFGALALFATGLMMLNGRRRKS